MTPAIQLLNKQRIEHTIHQYQHDEKSSSYGLEAAEKLAVNPRQVFKTLVVSLDGNTLAVAILPVREKLSMKLLAQALGAKKAAMAEPLEVQRGTGYVLGGVSPIGQKKRLPVVIDESAQGLTAMYISAGRRGLEIELCPFDLQSLLNAKFFQLCM